MSTVSVNTPFFQSIRDDMGLSDEEAELVRLAQFDWFRDRPCNDGAEEEYYAATLIQSIVRMFQAQAYLRTLSGEESNRYSLYKFLYKLLIWHMEWIFI